MTVDYSAWSETPAENVTLNGVPVSDGNLQPNQVDFGFRSLMAAIKTLSLAIPSVSSFVTKTAGVFSGTQPTYASEGAFLHHASSSMSSGRVHVLPEGSANPAGLSNGDLIVYYTP